MSSSLQKNMPAIVAGVLCLLVLILATSNFVRAEETGSSTETNVTNPSAKRGQNQLERQSVTAEHASTSDARVAKRAQTKAERSDTIKLKQEKIQAAHADRKVALQATAQNRITNLAANLNNRLDAVVNRMQDIINRLGSRIDKLNELGVDTNTASDSLANAQQEIDRARAILVSIDTEVAEFIGSEDPKTKWNNLRAVYSEARDAIKSSHQAVKITIEALKESARTTNLDRGVSGAVSNNENDNASTTQ
ncbi:hypothetical protein A2592_02595 [Candidatus Kaiserbacteria bacterium RIFOXYD1_FULL_42_15]|uniref:DUF5667 domain-containing protein n=1 Tax=Candidatus Kaiserbacteria bacterium RIFOXYD1_FULL_42_15 TaxID=1798532 RepID=A0A1F6FRA2_9BACT|nr:MAG: hypothetical protein A2592_02595 [Candidatus Kaiserbacteria bacterium RIFOXYD1_FULL_42_15]